MSETGTDALATQLEALEDLEGYAETGTLSQALFDFDGEREDMLPFKEGDIVTILEISDSGWWKGTTLNGKVGIFPYSYVALKTESQESFPVARCLFKLEATEEDMLSFEAGDEVTVLREINNDWSHGKTKDGKTGKFPVKYVEFTGRFDEETFKEETEKWEKVEMQKRKEIERIKQEKEELKKKLKEQELLETKQSLERMRMEAERLKMANQQQQAEIEKAKLELERVRKEEETRRQEEIKREINAARERAEQAERELEQARAEAAMLRKKQEMKDARKSVMVREKIELEQKMMKDKINKVSTEFDSKAPGPPPELRRHNSTGSLTEENLEFLTTEELFPDKASRNGRPKKAGALFKPVYVGSERAIVEEAEPEKANISSLAEGNPLPKETPIARPDTAQAVDNNADENDEVEGEESIYKNKKKKKVLSKFANLGKGPSCKKCKKPVGIANRVKACNGEYHDTCFRCSTCDKIIRNGEYVDRNDNPYCLVCHKRGFGPKGYGFGAGTLSPTDANENKTEGEITKPDKKASAKVITESWV